MYSSVVTNLRVALLRARACDKETFRDDSFSLVVACFTSGSETLPLVGFTADVVVVVVVVCFNFLFFLPLVVTAFLTLMPCFKSKSLKNKHTRREALSRPKGVYIPISP